MPINSITAPTAMTVYEDQTFISRHFINPASVLSSYTITTAASPVGSGFATAVTVSINGTSLTISGKYTRIFIDNEWDLRLAKMNSNIGTYYSLESIPDEYWGPTRFKADTRNSINVSINIVTNNGSTSITQIVRNDWSRQRNQLLDVVYNGLADRNSINRISDIPLPQAIDSDAINTSFPFTTSITTNVADYNITNAALAAGWSGISPLLANITVAAGVYVYATTTSNAGMATGTLPAGSAVNIVNNGFIIGKGGAGARYSSFLSVGVDGETGGPALDLGFAVNITNNGYIAGGGGGGGAVRQNTSCFAGGGGGAGGGDGQTSAGGGVGSVAGGAGGGPGSTGSNGQTGPAPAGIPFGAGAGGGRILPGTGGNGCDSSGAAQGGGAGGGGGSAPAITFGGATGQQLIIQGRSAGGGGGGWGASGGQRGDTQIFQGGDGGSANNPGTGNFADGFTLIQLPGAGGKAINLNGYTATFAVTGTVWGAVS